MCGKGSRCFQRPSEVWLDPDGYAGLARRHIGTLNPAKQLAGNQAVRVIFHGDLYNEPGLRRHLADTGEAAPSGPPVGRFFRGGGCRHRPSALGARQRSRRILSAVLAYDMYDLLAVKNGTRDPWSLEPYAFWPITFPMSPAAGQDVRLSNAAYDSANNRIYIAQTGCCDVNDYGDPKPIIHVFQVNP
jgi:hypothetical protein